MHRQSTRSTRSVGRSARGAVFLEMLALLLVMVLVLVNGSPGLASSIRGMLCGMVYGMEGRDPEKGRISYTADPAYGAHCWKWERRVGPTPTLYYF